MDVTIATLGQRADIHLLEFYPAIAREKHTVPFLTGRFRIPDVNPRHGWDCYRAHKQQKIVRKLQAATLAKGKIKAENLHDDALLAARRQEAEALQSKYWKAASNLAIRHDRILSRIAKYQAA